jgi:hypothetical protein
VARAQYTTDRDGDAPAAARVCIVAVQPATFDRCRAGVYPVPGSYNRARERFAYLGLYRTAPVSAVTHYAPVRARTEQTRGRPGPLDPADWVATVDPFSGERTVVVVELGDLVALETPVENDATGVRGAWYCTVGDLRAAETLSELGARS